MRRKYNCTMFENKEYMRDTGCEFYGKCLDCPFPMCIKAELSPAKRAMFLKVNPTLFEYAELIRR